MNETKLKQILINLLSNSYKFTRIGSVTLKVINLDNLFLKVEIIDTGAGISEEEKKTIFEPYKTIDRNEGMNNHGSGLGLPLVKEILGFLNVELEINSSVNVGTNISFKLDLKLLEEIHENFSNKDYIINKLMSNEHIKETIPVSNCNCNYDANDNVLLNSKEKINRENSRKFSVNSNIFGFNENSFQDDKATSEKRIVNNKSEIEKKNLDEFRNSSRDYFNIKDESRSVSFASSKTMKLDNNLELIDFDEIKQSLLLLAKNIQTNDDNFYKNDEKETNIEGEIFSGKSKEKLNVVIEKLTSDLKKDEKDLSIKTENITNVPNTTVKFKKINSDNPTKRNKQRNLSITNNYLKKISIDSLPKLISSDPSCNKKNYNDNSIKRSCTSDLESVSKNENNDKFFEKAIMKLLNPFTKKESYKTLSNINSSSSGSLKLIHKSSSIMKYHSKNTTENFFAVKEENENYGIDSDNSTNLDESIDLVELDEVVNYMNYVYNQNKNKNIMEDTGISIKIIVCDDENVVTNSVKRLIETFCIEQNKEVFVATCFNGIEVINRIVEDSNRNICYSLLLIDEELPYLDGNEVIKILKKMQKKKEIYNFPIYSVTGHDSEDFLNNLLSIGADGVIKKPMNKKSLSSILTKLKLLDPK